jgi:hypothetical protein
MFFNLGLKEAFYLLILQLFRSPIERASITNFTKTQKIEERR